RANAMKTMATPARTWRNGAAPRKRFERTVRLSASTSMGARPVHNFDHRNARMPIGDVRMIQKAGPSAETAGKTNRAATADSTKAAIARFTNAYVFLMTPLM